MTRLCECGCGMPAPIATVARPKNGVVKGQPLRFIRGHNTRLRASPSDGLVKLCTRCREPKPVSGFGKAAQSGDGLKPSCRTCVSEAARRKREADGENYRARQREANRRYREKNRERLLAQKREKFREAYQANPEEFRERSRQARAADPEEHRARVRRDIERNRTAVFEHYGWVCTCCGSTDRPTIDHINGDGRQHREQVRCGSGSGLYRWLVRNGFPEGFQTLCWPCNDSKKNGPKCRLNHTGHLTSLRQQRGAA